jgi:hypothetical protein
MTVKMMMKKKLILSKTKKKRDPRLRGLAKIFKIQTAKICSRGLNMLIEKQIIIPNSRNFQNR